MVWRAQSIKVKEKLFIVILGEENERSKGQDVSTGKTDEKLATPPTTTADQNGKQTSSGMTTKTILYIFWVLIM